MYVCSLYIRVEGFLRLLLSEAPNHQDYLIDLLNN